MIEEEAEDICDIYLDITIDGLSLTYLRVEALDDHSDYEVLIPETVFSFSPHDFVHKPMHGLFNHDLPMLWDAQVSLIDGQSLQISRLEGFLDPVVLTYKKSPVAEPTTFSFSLEHALDAIDAEQKSGHYCMTIDYFDSKTARFLAIKDISITQG